MKKTILALLLAGATWVTGCGSSNDFNPISGQPGNPNPIITPTPTPTTGYFVDATNGNDTTGSFNTGAPYKTLTAVVTAAPVNALITLRPGTYSESVTLKNGQQLVGPSTGSLPLLTGTTTLGDGNVFGFLKFQGASDSALIANNVNGGTITKCEFADTTNFGDGLQADAVTGTWIIEDNTMTNLAGIGVSITANLGDDVVAQVNRNTITGNDFNAMAFVTGDDGTMRLQMKDNIMSGNQPNFTVEIITGGTSDFVAQIVGNTNNDVYRLSRNVTTSTLRIERLAQLTTLNSGGATVNELLEAIIPVNNGDAGFGPATP